MKKILAISAFAVALPFAAAAQETGIEVPSLQSVLSTMNESEISAAETNIAEQGTISGDLDVAIDQAVSEAVAEGLITADQADDAAAALEIVNANSQFFNFDILDVIGEGLENGDFDIESVRETLGGFQNLSDAGKGVVGNEQFSVYQFDQNDNIVVDGNGDPVYSNDFSALSSADQSVILNQMPILSDDGQ